MIKRYAWVLAGAVIATAGVAHAQPAAAPSEATAQRAGTPWYQRFTTSTGVAETVTGMPENDRLPQASWSLNQRWGVTVDVREAQRLDRPVDSVREDETAVGAYYQFTPRVRLGGEVSLGAAQRTPANPVARQDQEPAAGVRIESAFRF